jgi:hypothetical protein
MLSAGRRHCGRRQLSTGWTRILADPGTFCQVAGPPPGIRDPGGLPYSPPYQSGPLPPAQPRPAASPPTRALPPAQPRPAASPPTWALPPAQPRPAASPPTWALPPAQPQPVASPSARAPPRSPPHQPGPLPPARPPMPRRRARCRVAGGWGWRALPQRGCGRCDTLVPCVVAACFLLSRADSTSLARLPLVERGVFCLEQKVDGAEPSGDIARKQ